ncbi:putative transcription regulator PAB1642, partial [Aspergillus aculeatinus CBS 121060]
TSPTAHPFLSAAAAGTLPKPRLAAWLAQDRLYIHAYIRFIGALLAKLQLPVPVPVPVPHAAQTNTNTHNAVQNTPANNTDQNETPTLESQTLHTLTAALTNIVRELDFFVAVADEYALDLNTPFQAPHPEPGEAPAPAPAPAAPAAGTFTASPITTAYTDLFISAGSAGTSLLEGLVVLWATEVCYLTVWRNVRAAMPREKNRGEDADGGALREKLIPNWTCAEFEEFVEGITRLVDKVAEREVQRSSAGPGKAWEEVLERCARWWRQVVWLEGQFWPEV